MAASFTIPGGPKKGMLLAEAEDKDIRFWFDRIGKALADDPNKKFADRDRAWLAAGKTELVKRGVSADDLPMPQARPTPRAAEGQSNGHANGGQSNTSIVRAAGGGQVVAGAFSDAGQATGALMNAAESCHLVSPATIVGRLPEGCEVAVSMVPVDPYGREVYQVTGTRDRPSDGDTVGIDRVALDKIAAAAGGTWIYSRRTDDGSHPHYCAWEARIRFRNFDMSYSDYIGNVEIDTREEGGMRGAAAEEIRQKAERNPYCKDGGNSQLLELRKFLTRHAESKAKNRAIASRGVRRSYKREELKKPFAVARLIFTGHSDDPEARKEFRQMIGQSFLASATAMYGADQPMALSSQTVQSLPPAQVGEHVRPAVVMTPASGVLVAPAFTPHAPPPVGTQSDQGGDWEDYPDDPAPAQQTTEELKT